MKYLSIVGFAFLFAFVVIFVISAESKNLYAFIAAELFAFIGIGCLAIANKQSEEVS